jgi:flagellar basal-body rod protein FlgF
MDNSIYITLSRQLTLFRDMAVTANNIANADTPGYNAEKMMFTDYLVDDGNRHKMAFNQDISSYRDLSQGPLRQTGNPFDLAISGPGYFMVETALGTRYTKAGNFTIGSDGMLMTTTGNPVLDIDGGRVFVEPTDREITIGETGAITVRTPAGAREERGQVGMVEFANEQAMERVNAQLYKTDQEPQEPVQARMLQGVIESSNISPVLELVRTTELSRSTTSTAKFIEVMYDLERKTSNTYTRSES